MASKPDKIFRDPLYNYISVSREHDAWLLELLDCPEVQRLRRIHQLGVSYLTYPGADHNRLAHSLGVLHLMQQALSHLAKVAPDAQVDGARDRMLAVALLHDVGHGPFSHLFEPCLDIDHEIWSKRVILDPATQVNQVLSRRDTYLPQMAADLIEKDKLVSPSWQKALLSSQLDMDRMDYLRRDSLFTGAGYGHFDFFRLLNTFELHDGDDIVWVEKSKFAIEEYVFARYYMYQNVYLHKTTRGFEKMVEAMWRRARTLMNDGGDVSLVPAIQSFWRAGNDKAASHQYLDIEEHTVLQQIQQWKSHVDKPLRDLAQAFLNRRRFSAIDPPPQRGNPLAGGHAEWESALSDLVRRHGYDTPDAYCLKDQVKGKYHQPYFPERESDEQSARNAIRLRIGGTAPVEISTVLPRLQPVTQKPLDQVRYYVPPDVRARAEKLRAEWV